MSSDCGGVDRGGGGAGGLPGIDGFVLTQAGFGKPGPLRQQKVSREVRCWAIDTIPSCTACPYGHDAPVVQRLMTATRLASLLNLARSRSRIMFILVSLSLSDSKDGSSKTGLLKMQ